VAPTHRRLTTDGVALRLAVGLRENHGWPTQINDQLNLIENAIRLNADQNNNDKSRTIPIVPDLAAILRMQCAKWPVNFCAPVSRLIPTLLRFQLEISERSGRIVASLLGSGNSSVCLVRSGVPQRVAMQITEHNTRSVLDRYNVISISEVADERKVA
jgi:hypothetical protein